MILTLVYGDEVVCSKKVEMTDADFEQAAEGIYQSLEN